MLRALVPFLKAPTGRKVQKARFLNRYFLGGVAFASLALIARAAAPSGLPNTLPTANVWLSGTAGQGVATAMAPTDQVGTLDVETFVQGDLNISSLSLGAHQLPVVVTDQNGTQSRPFPLDVVVYNSRWSWGQAGSDTNNNGLPDAWEQYWFGANPLSLLTNPVAPSLTDPYADPNGNLVNNLNEVPLNTDPNSAVNPGPVLVSAEYFIDTDPGAGKGIALPASPALTS